ETYRRLATLAYLLAGYTGRDSLPCAWARRVGFWRYDGMAGPRTGGTGDREAGPGAVRRPTTQDDRHPPGRLVAVDIRDRGGLRGWGTGLRLDAALAQGRGSPSGPAVRPAQCHGRPGGGRRSAMARRSEDLRPGGTGRTGHRRTGG